MALDSFAGRMSSDVSGKPECGTVRTTGESRLDEFLEDPVIGDVISTMVVLDRRLVAFRQRRPSGPGTDCSDGVAAKLADPDFIESSIVEQFTPYEISAFRDHFVPALIDTLLLCTLACLAIRIKTDNWQPWSEDRISNDMIIQLGGQELSARSDFGALMRYRDICDAVYESFDHLSVTEIAIMTRCAAIRCCGQVYPLAGDRLINRILTLCVADGLELRFRRNFSSITEPVFFILGTVWHDFPGKGVMPRAVLIDEALSSLSTMPNTLVSTKSCLSPSYAGELVIRWFSLRVVVDSKYFSENYDNLKYALTAVVRKLLGVSIRSGLQKLVGVNNDFIMIYLSTIFMYRALSSEDMPLYDSFEEILEYEVTDHLCSSDMIQSIITLRSILETLKCIRRGDYPLTIDPESAMRAVVYINICDTIYFSPGGEEYHVPMSFVFYSLLSIVERPVEEIGRRIEELAKLLRKEYERSSSLTVDYFMVQRYFHDNRWMSFDEYTLLSDSSASYRDGEESRVSHYDHVNGRAPVAAVVNNLKKYSPIAWAKFHDVMQTESLAICGRIARFLGIGGDFKTSSDRDWCIRRIIDDYLNKGGHTWEN